MRGNDFPDGSMSGFTREPASRKVGERCSIVTLAAFWASAGISEIAVAPPLPMTITFLPV